MSYSRRGYRHRNPKAESEQKPASFFTHAGKGKVQTKKDSPFFQTKLTVGEAGDKYEQEADAVANQVVDNSQSAAGGPPPVQRKKINKIQRLASSKEDEKLGTNDERMRRDKDIQFKADDGVKEEEEKNVQMKTQEEEKDEMKAASVAQRKPDGQSGAAVSPGLSSRIGQSSGKGKALPRKTLGDMHAAFGHDFTGVNIHADQDAAAMNKELGAQAFTHGEDIFFNNGKYNPDTAEGKRLLAHELTHVVQQSSDEDKSTNNEQTK